MSDDHVTSKVCDVTVKAPITWTRFFFSRILAVVCSGLRWFAVVCGGLWWFDCSYLVSLPIVPNSGGDLWWFAVICGGCGGLR